MRPIFILITILSIAACSHTETEKKLYERVDLLHERNDSLKKILNICRESFRIRLSEGSKNIDFYMNQYDSIAIGRRGIEMSCADIIADLYSHNDMIPHEAVLGGTMHFDGIRIMGDRYALAYISDGHVLGRLVARFDPTDEGKIKWTILDSYIDGE